MDSPVAKFVTWNLAKGQREGLVGLGCSFAASCGCGAGTVFALVLLLPMYFSADKC
jgi:hypothetical protein